MRIGRPLGGVCEPGQLGPLRANECERGRSLT
jgi:hypothetical protein